MPIDNTLDSLFMVNFRNFNCKILYFSDTVKGLRRIRRVESANGDTWNAPEVDTEWMSKI